MRVLHAAAHSGPPSGILDQMRWERRSAQELGLNWTVKMFCPKDWTEPDPIIQEASRTKADSAGLTRRAYNWITFRKEYHAWLKTQEDAYDIFLLRYYRHDPFQLLFVLSCRKPVYFVFHTLVIQELASQGGWIGWIRSNMERIIGKPTLKNAAGIIGVTQEIIEHQKRRVHSFDGFEILYPNGILFDQDPVTKPIPKVPELIFVSSCFCPWHGLDLLLNSVEKSTDSFTLHLVGELEVKDYDRAKVDKRIRIHGHMSHEEIRVLASHCTVGLSSFALYRNNMKEACTLKVREYLMMGLPVYAGCKDVVLPDDFAYYRIGEPSIERILEYARNVEGVDRKDVADNSRYFIDKRVLLKKLFDSLNNRTE